jgi:hypothetical protein
VALIVLVPLVSGIALRGLDAYAHDRRQAALDLQKLGNHVNGLAADMGWAIAVHLPRQAVEPVIRADQARVATDLGSLRADTAAGIGVTDVERAAAFSSGFQGMLALLDGQGIDGSAARRPQAQHDALIALIRAAHARGHP